MNKLEFRNGCIYCLKVCKFSGLQVNPESHNAAKRGEKGLIIKPSKSDLYNCNSTKI